jgi:beta-mannosidase
VIPVLAVLALQAQASSWTVQIEEPTGLYRRIDEVVSVPLAKLGGHTKGFTVTDPYGREMPWQVSAASGQLLFPVSLIPGQLPQYRIACCKENTAAFVNPIILRRVGMQRVELGNGYFRAMVDLGAGAITDVYSIRTQSPRMLNLVETSPESKTALKGDIHESARDAATAIPPPVPGVDGENTGWTTLGGKGPFTNVELLEAGPLRGRLRLTRAGETWDITWTSGSAAFRWKATGGFRFTSISAAPYLPFNRCVGGSEYTAPTGPGEDEPEPNRIEPRAGYDQLPGGHIVYYQREEDYGALGIVALDSTLRWKGACSRRVLATRPGGGETEIAITFPQWNTVETFLEARRENRMLRQPVLVSSPVSGNASLRPLVAAEREPVPVFGKAAATPFRENAFSLNGADWELMWAEKGQGPPQSGWRKVSVPGTAHVQWLGNDESKIYSREAEWISGKEWWYRKTVRVPEALRNAARLRLQFEATDYYADTWVNGAFLGRHEGYIDPYEYDLPNDAVELRILVRVWTPVHYYWKHRPYTVKGAYGAVDQKPDDITALGITRAVRLAASGPASIADIAVDTRLKDGKGSAAEVEVYLGAHRATGMQWELTLAPRNFGSPNDRIQVRVPASANSVTIPVPDPQLWWTRDYGKPNLYTLTARLLDSQGTAVDGREIAVGIREIERIGWHFYLNRRKFFVRGTNYYFHLYMSEMDRAKYERDVDLMLGMNVNMIRVHCHFSNREFYDLADEKGVLLWQDFLEAWYPHDRGFALHAAPLYDNLIRYARNHPSVASWTTSDEEDFENYRVITKHLAPRPFWLDPQYRPVVRSTGRFGDSHVYHGWYDGSIWDYTQMTENFVSELGATSLPNYETLKRFMGGKWPIQDHLDEWVWRRLQIKEAFRAWGEPSPGMTLEQYVPQTQAYVARLFQLAIERTRQRKSEGAGGIFHFHAIDIWPSITMAAIDFDRRPTKTYETVKRSFEPVAALFQYDRDQWKAGEKFKCTLWAANDRWEAVANAKLRWKIMGPGGAVRQEGVLPVKLAADSSERAGLVEWTVAASETGPHEMRAAIVDAQGKVISENVYEFQVVAVKP